MANIKIESFCIAGIAVRTSNAPGMAEKDIPQLWERFFAENIIGQLPHKTSNDIYCVYTQYQKDYTEPYNDPRLQGRKISTGAGRLYQRNY